MNEEPMLSAKAVSTQPGFPAAFEKMEEQIRELREISGQVGHYVNQIAGSQPSEPLRDECKMEQPDSLLSMLHANIDNSEEIINNFHNHLLRLSNVIG